MKLPFMTGLAVLALMGCASDSDSQRAQDDWNETAVEKADESRAKSDQTVYDESATGGSGTDESVTTDDGVRWDTLEEPRGDEPQVPEALPDADVQQQESGDDTQRNP